ncbi:E3 ubiquitin-protein ligase IPI1-like isoform X2 [Phragmites australis]|uniref:E3 ubiquitin-protein ligase IPI1-like isoform X2 n=1 Tax=Phragmites australis TaxID=29695 RepID=UPI002D79EF8C|nr:E3 ubiquitin-protein ligase IPI1-like isoform X2 [Phragmites australis]
MGVGAEEEVETAVVAEGGGGGEQEEQEGGGGDAEDRKGEGEEKAAAVMSCSICLDAVVAGGEDRSTARLQCGHEFHLDCIGSAFNAKGIMQCPNCRKIETGNWLYANGSRSSQDVNNDEWGYDEDLYDVAHSEVATFVPFRVQWCPIGRLAQLPSLFDEVDPSPPAAFHDFIGQNFNEHVSVSVPATAHPERTIDTAGYHDRWTPLAGTADGRPLQPIHPIDFHHNPWAHMPHSYSQSNNNNSLAEQPAVPVGAMRVGGVDSDNQQRGLLPSFYGNGSGSRPRIASVPPMAPQFIRAHGNINEQFQQSSSSLFAGSQRSGGMQPLGAGGPALPPPENTSFCLFPPVSSGPSSMENEDVGGNQFYAWERDRFAPYPLMSVNNEGTWWSSSQQQQPHGTPEPASASRRLSRQWIDTGRSPPENRLPDNLSFRQLHIPRM